MDEKVEDTSDDWEVVELLNRTSRLPRERGRPDRLYSQDAERFMRELASGSEASDTAEDRFSAWDDGAEYARAAEVAGVDVGGMLEAGVDAKKLLDFVSNYRRAEGEQLRLLDNQNLKFATSQVLRNGRRARAEAASTPTEDVRSSKKGPASRATSPTFDVAQEGSQSHTRTFQHPRSEDTHGHNRPAKGPRPASATRGVFGEDDGAETARLCGELLRYSSALEEKSSETCTSQGEGNENDPPPSRRREQAHRSRRNREKDAHTTESAPSDDLGIDPRESRRSVPEFSKGGDASYQRRGNRTAVDTAEEWDWAEGVEPLDASPARYGERGRANGMGNGHPRPTPSYALPTKHFKTLGRDRGDALTVEESGGRKVLQRQAQLKEENAALKLRLEGQRRAIHELEHQAHSLRETARQREESFQRLKRKLAATPPTTTREKCPQCANAHQGRPRSGRDTAAGALRKRVMAAELRVRELEKSLADSRAQEQRAREIGVSLKCNYSGAQDKAAGLETELASMQQSLLEARQDIAETRREAKAHLKNAQKHRRQRDERTREAEIARAEAADLTLRLRKAVKELEVSRAETVALRRERARAEARENDLTRENSMLKDRLTEGRLPRAIRDRDRWIMSELRSEPESLHRGMSISPNRKQRPMRGRYRHTGHVAPSAADPGTSDDDVTRTVRGTGRRRRLGEAALDSSPPSASPERRGGLPHCPKARVGGFRGQAKDTGGHPSPGDGRRAHNQYGTRKGWEEDGLKLGAGLARGLSTRSADDDATDCGGREGAAVESSSLSAGGNRSTMGARYERLQAMYRRVNRRDAGARGRAGVG